jgi:hypothetical protein
MVDGGWSSLGIGEPVAILEGQTDASSHMDPEPYREGVAGFPNGRHELPEGLSVVVFEYTRDAAVEL